MSRRLFAFDLDGTLLNSRKELSEANLIALKEMAASGAVIAFASGRLGSSMMQYVPILGFEIAMLTLNGAEVYATTKKDSCVYHSPRRAEFADYHIDY
jgi:HAD superfamily hydrolase (TIGR01484 family)